MAIVLEANYSKKLGLPEYSSHQYSVSVRSELTDLTQLEEESARLFHLLQDSVDSKIKEPGYLPSASSQNNPQPRVATPQWNCSEKQEKLICDLLKEHRIQYEDIDSLACQMFDKPLVQLNKLEASGIIDELIRQYGKPKVNGSNPRTNGRAYTNGSRFQRGGSR